MYSIDVSSENFQQTVIDASYNTPVVVDFWAPWCGPCRTLKPLLEKLAQEYQGKFILAKINSDEQSTLAAQFGVRGIPDVKAVVKGKVVDGFSGALPESAVRQFLERVIPSPGEEIRLQALAARNENRLEDAWTLLLQAESIDPGHTEIQIDKAAVLMARKNYPDARNIIEQLPVNVRQREDVVKMYTEIEVQEKLAHLPDCDTLLQNIKDNPKDLQSRLDLANYYIAQQQYEDAFTQLFEIIKTDRQFQDDIGRLTVLSIFTLLGNQHELVKRYRRQLAMLLN